MIYHIRKFLRKKKNSFYQDKLINKLNKEHQKLVEIVGMLEGAVDNQDINQIRLLLKRFKQELELHVLYEDTNLYEYLYWKYYFFEDIRKAIHNKQAEMGEIIKTVQNFIKQYQNLNDINQFIQDFEIVKEVLVKRVQFEEEILYDIYNNFYKWQEVLKKIENYS
jgi:hemerythrin